MSLLDSLSLIEIKLYYKFAKLGNGRKLVILEDKAAEKMMEDEEHSKEIEILATKWSTLTWKEQNEVMHLAAQPANPAGDRQFNFVNYRDAIIKRCLKEWNITANEKPVPVTSQAIDQLPGPVVTNLYQKFEKMLDYTEEESGN